MKTYKIKHNRHTETTVTALDRADAIRESFHKNRSRLGYGSRGRMMNLTEYRKLVVSCKIV